MRNIFILLIVTLGCAKTPPPFKITKQQSNTNSLLIGLHVLDAKTAWASGTKATVLLTTDGGQNWGVFQNYLADSLQFRDIHALNPRQAVVMSAGEGALSRIFLFDLQDTSWTETYRMPHENGFLDAIAFWDDQNAIAYGDAVNGKPFILLSQDGGLTWTEVSAERLPDALPGEGGFASSGTNIAVRPGGLAMIGTGAGGNARLLISPDYGQTWEVKATPMVKGEAAGITSVRFVTDQKGIIVGGDLTIKETYTDNLFITDSRGSVWYPMSRPFTTGGFYGSAFKVIGDQTVIIITGPQGADISYDLGAKWQMVTNKNLWSVDLHESGTGWLVGNKGTIYKIEL